jgi:hypothetical protein
VNPCNQLFNLTNDYSLKGTKSPAKDMQSSCIFISYYFPPIHSVAVIRNYNIASELKDAFDNFYVFSTSNQKLLHQEGHHPGDINVRLLYTFDYRTLIAKLNPKRKSTHFSEPAKSNRFFSFLIRLNESLPFSLLFGEGGLLYIINGFFQGKKLLIAASGKKYIYTSYRPAANIVIGYLLKRAYPDTIWIASFHDVPVDITRRNVLLPSLQHWLYKKLLSKSDLNISVSEGVAEQLKMYSEKLLVMRNGITIREPSDRVKSQKFTVCYTGSLYQDFRNPTLLFIALQELIAEGILKTDDFIIQYAGKDGQKWHNFMATFPGLLDSSQIMGEVTHAESLTLQQQADVNLLLTWSDQNHKGMLTGKLYEYIGSCNPVICLVTGDAEDDELNNIFSDLHCGLICYVGVRQSKQILKTFIRALFVQWKETDTYTPYILKALPDLYSWKNQVNKLISAM